MKTSQITFNEIPEVVAELLSKVNIILDYMDTQNTQTEKAPAFPEIMNIEQAAEFLGRKKATLYGYVHRREIPFIKKGKKLTFRKSDLDSWLNDGKVPTMQDEIEEIEISMLKSMTKNRKK